jgi:hypothetical protein
MTPEQAKALREPFPKSAIGKMPKAGMQLDYVGHAAVTQRLLEVDPEWTWAPMCVDEMTGKVQLDDNGGLWIWLTVAGVTRPGYGDGGNSKSGDAVKVAIGDAIRNAAMRFGVALDLWAKEDIGTTFEHPKPVASDKQIAKWTAAISAAPDSDHLKSIGAEISGYALPDQIREDLRGMFQSRQAELDA